MYSLHEQYIDTKSGFHVLKFRDEKGNEHIGQIALGHDSCQACGKIHPQTNLGEIDPKAFMEQVLSDLNKSQSGLKDYGAKHGVTLR